jgi:NAD(P)-dependent dehydrogenase (short-subunit alcohol dehydrogenase family)
MAALVGKVVLITGAGRGIGRATALACAREGAQLVLNDLGCDPEGTGADPEVVEGVCREVRAAGGQAIASAEDITGAATPDALVTLCHEQFGRLDAVLHAAGSSQPRVLSRADDASIDRALDVHVRAAVRLTRAASALMQTQGDGGSILLCSSQAAFTGQREHSASCAANAAVVGFVRAAALELRRHRIRVNALAPLARTRMTVTSPMFQSVRSDSLQPEHVAAVATYLLSPISSEVSGECVGAAGGRIYVLRLHETTGAFVDEATLDMRAAADAWPQATKG